MKRNDHHLVQRVLDGDVSPEEFALFQQRLREEPELVKLYEDYALVHHTLIEEYDGGHAAESGSPFRERRLFGASTFLAVAAVLALAAGLWWYRPWIGRLVPDDVAVVSFSVDAVWHFDGPTWNLGGATAVSRGVELHLRQGRANVSLEPSVTALIEGPAELVFIAPDSLHLESGRGYFHRGGNGGRLTVSTPAFTARDSGTEFGIQATPGGPVELHVVEGTVTMIPKSDVPPEDFSEGVAARVSGVDQVEPIAIDAGRFARGLGKFRTVVSDPFVKSKWRLEYGTPSFGGHEIDGANYSAFLRLPGPEPAAGGGILLVTLGVRESVAGEFHTDGWAGLSLYSGGEEVLFFGDTFGNLPTWSLDVKQQVPVISPDGVRRGTQGRDLAL